MSCATAPPLYRSNIKVFRQISHIIDMSFRTLLLTTLASSTVSWNSEQAARSRCWSSGNGQSARWWNEGEKIDRGKFWYECQRGVLAPMGCFTEKNERLDIGGSYENGGYISMCDLGSDGYLQFKYTACVSQEGQRYGPGDTWTDPKNIYYYTCKADGPYLKVVVEGCITHDKARRIAIGEKDDYGDYTYECQQKYNGSVQLCSVGCIHQGAHYKVGEQWPEGEFIYYCKLNGGRCQKICIGCQYRNKRLYDGDRYTKEDTVYQCEIRSDSFGHKPVGCLSKDSDGSAIERVIGCRWYQQTYDSKVEQTCELDGNKTVVKTVGCIYRYKGFDTIFLYPGTYTIWNLPRQNKSLGLACKITEYGAKLETFDVSEAQNYTGLKYDQPRGK